MLPWRKLSAKHHVRHVAVLEDGDWWGVSEGLSDGRTIRARNHRWSPEGSADCGLCGQVKMYCYTDRQYHNDGSVFVQVFFDVVHISSQVTVNNTKGEHYLWMLVASLPECNNDSKIIIMASAEIGYLQSLYLVMVSGYTKGLSVVGWLDCRCKSPNLRYVHKSSWKATHNSFSMWWKSRWFKGTNMSIDNPVWDG